MISTILPVLDEYKLTNDLLECISKNEYKPAEIILIDNGSIEPIFELVKIYSNLNIQYVRLDENIGVNPAWNVGIEKAKYDVISILNNDIIIGKYFFRSIKDTMFNRKNQNIGICVPNTIKEIDMVIRDTPYEKPILQEIDNREGWAFTIRRKIIELGGYIPTELKIFSGDTFFFDTSKKLGFKNYKIMNCYAFHYKSVTVRKYQFKVSHLRKEREYYQKFLRDKIK